MRRSRAVDAPRPRFWTSRHDGARWRRGVDGFRRLALRGQVLNVLARAVTVPLAYSMLHVLASRVAHPGTFGLVAVVNSYGWMSVRLILVPALALWLLLRLH